MRRAADEVEESLSWVGARFVSQPTDPRKLVELLWAADLWAFSEVFRVFRVFQAGKGDLTREKFQRRTLGPALDEMQSQGLPAPESDAWKATISRTKRNIRPGEHDAVVADVLSAIRSGPFDRTGAEIRSR
jgi:hypothetical protein